METENAVRRIPRPKGITNMARTGSRNVLYDTMVKNYLRGNIPEAATMSAHEFALLYNIPEHMVLARIKDGLSSELIQDNNLVQDLEKERLKILSSSLFRLGDSDLQLNRLLAYLGRRILGSPGAPAFLIKELNGAIGTQVRLTETSLKAITILNQALSTIVPTAQEDKKEEHLTKIQILQELERLAGPNLDHYLEGTPDLAPHNLGSRRIAKAQSSNPAVHEYTKGLEVHPIPVLPNHVSLPR